MLTSSRNFAILAVAGFMILYGGPWIVVLTLGQDHPRAPDMALGLMMAGLLLLAGALAPILVRFFFRRAAHMKILSARFAESGPQRSLADAVTLAIWIVWAVGMAVVLAAAWPDMRASLAEGMIPPRS